MSAGRSPCGERGLKYGVSDKQVAYATSLPVRGAWVEIALIDSDARHADSRSPCGERGLKFIVTAVCHEWVLVSLPVRGAWVEIVA